MTKPVPCLPAPGPLEEYAARFDDLFTRVAQRRGFREYLAGLLAPRDRNKTLTALAGAEPVAGAQHPAVPRRRGPGMQCRRLKPSDALKPYAGMCPQTRDRGTRHLRGYATHTVTARG